MMPPPLHSSRPNLRLRTRCAAARPQFYEFCEPGLARGSKGQWRAADRGAAVRGVAAVVRLARAGAAEGSRPMVRVC